MQITEYFVTNLDRALTVATRVAVADTSHSRRKGLLGRDKLEPGSGLWIAPCEAIHTFGMQWSIDVIFLDRNFRIRKLTSQLKPRRLSICVRAYSVLELEAGAIARTGARIGDHLRFQLASAH